MKLLSGIALLSLLIFGCVNLSPMAGGTTDTGNSRVSATVYETDGHPAAGARVTLLKSGTFDGARVTGTDERGRFALDSVDTGRYSIEVNDRKSAACLFVCTVHPGAQTTPLDPDTIRPYAAIRGTVALSQGAVGNTFVRVYGLDRNIPVSEKGDFVIDDLPAGSFRLRISSINESFTPLEIDSVTTASTATTALPYAGWSFTKRLYLNTTFSGANVTGTVMSFPMLVRLSGVNFNFSEAAGNGADLRFTKSDDTPLAYEIERWDSAGAAAEVWVKVDTVHGNNYTQFILMHWGARTGSATLSFSNSAAVFDTAIGFQGVWHLNDPGDAPAFDATANHYDGTPYGMDAASAKTGRIGKCREFNGDSGSFIMEKTADSKLNFPEDGSYTLSAWVWSDTLDDNMFFSIATKGDRQYDLLQWPSTPNDWMFSEWGQRGREVVDKPMEARNWTHVTGVRSGTEQLLYVNGVHIDALPLVKEPPDSLNTRYTGFDFMVGRIASKISPDTRYYFKGKIDELRACNIARSADWVKLSYMNQQFEDQLVEMR